MTRSVVHIQRWRCDKCGQRGEFEHRPEADASDLWQRAEEEHQIITYGCKGQLRFPAQREGSMS